MSKLPPVSRIVDFPACVRLAPEPGLSPSGKPPVRIFLGTEDAQHRAERVFVYSVERVRDRSRCYEIYLMRNLGGFDRSRWRTGFTSYRFAIPELAGGRGRAIYNDVDQIYFEDPAALFDTDLKGHGYLAVGALDTSVMLMDCERLVKFWNRQTAETRPKSRLIRQAASEPGLWGRLDGRWNARDMEYPAEEIKLIHYTALNTQPWHPTPERYSYHAHPLGYLWQQMEEDADRCDYQIFSAGRPSPDWQAPRPAAPTGQEAPSPAARALAVEVQARCLTELRLDGLSPMGGWQDLEVVARPIGGPAHALPEADLVCVRGLERMPYEDTPWLLDSLFARARRMVYLRLAEESGPVQPDARARLRDRNWWLERLDLTAGRFPGVSWHLDLSDGQDRLHWWQCARTAAPGRVPRVRLCPGRDTASAERLERFASLLPWPLEGAAMNSAGRVDAVEGSAPDLLLSSGPDGARAALRLKDRCRTGVRLVHLGDPGEDFRRFDLILAEPQDALPVRGNVVQCLLPLRADPGDVGTGSPGTSGQGPRLLVLSDTGQPPSQACRLLGRYAERIGARLCRSSRRQGPLRGPVQEQFEALELDADQPLSALVDGLVVLGAAQDQMWLAVTSGLPVTYWQEPTGDRPSRDLLPWLRRLLPAGATYRGTPFQQTFVGRAADYLQSRGWLPRRSGGGEAAWLDAWRWRGLRRLDELGDELPVVPVADRLEPVVARISALMTERRTSGRL